jgi:uncharacterized cupin superfamily protein
MKRGVGGEGEGSVRERVGRLMVNIRNHENTSGPTGTSKCFFWECTWGQFQRFTAGVERENDIVKWN